LDSGDLAYLSKAARRQFKETALRFNIPVFEHFNIVASNDINESVLLALNDQVRPSL
jgi:nicotinate phosphoribosyltransferase